MFGWPIHYIWLIVLVLGIVIEASTLALTSIWFAIAAIICYILGAMGVGFGIQVAVFFGLSVLLLISTKPIVKKYLNVGKVRTNADSLIGKTAVVVMSIEPLKNYGQVKVDGQIWSAKCKGDKIIELGEKVKIIAIEGVKLIVEEEK